MRRLTAREGGRGRDRLRKQVTPSASVGCPPSVRRTGPGRCCEVTWVGVAGVEAADCITLAEGWEAARPGRKAEGALEGPSISIFQERVKISLYEKPPDI